MTLTTQIDIDATPDRIWALLTDLPSHVDWNPFIRHISGDLRKGGRLEVRLGAPGTTPMTFTPVVTALRPARELAWLGTLGAGWLFAGEHRFRLEPLTGGRTRLHHSETFRGLLVGLFRTRLDRDTRRGFEAMNEALKREAERSHPVATI